MMNKIIFPDANDLLYKSMYGNMSTVITDDSSYYTNVKKAASSTISKMMMEEYKPDKDHFLIHLVALGDDETYGFNKNADGFPKKANENYHKTFEKYACLYREHKSSDKQYAIGQVKLAMYNPDMKRVEIIVHANKKLASEEYDIAKSGGALSFSMGTSVPWDRDNISGKKCKTPATYEPWMKACPGKYISDWEGKPVNKFAYVHNDEPKFFDISRVKSPADRTAHYLQYEFSKVASVHNITLEDGVLIPSALLAEQIGLQDPTIQKFSYVNTTPLYNYNLAKRNILVKLASIEEYCRDVLSSTEKSKDIKFNFVKHAALNTFDNTVTESDMNTVLELRPETVFYELSKRASVLPFETFVKTFLKSSYNEDAVKYASMCLLPTLFKDLLNKCETNTPISCDSALEDVFDAGDAKDASYDLNNTDEVQQIMNDIEDKLSLSDEKYDNRIKRCVSITKITTNNNGSKNTLTIIKKASDSTTDKDTINLAKSYTDIYGMYKIATLNNINYFKPLTEKQLILTIAQNFLAI